MLIGRYELIRVAQQANTSIPGDTSNLDAFTVASRWNPFMFSRAGLAIQTEYSWVRSRNVADIGTVLAPVPAACSPGCYVSASSVFLGVDFDF